MSDETERTELTEEELEQQRAEQLPDREVMSTIQTPQPLPVVEGVFDGGPEHQPPVPD
jgi:hypothetical protein